MIIAILYITKSSCWQHTPCKAGRHFTDLKRLRQLERCRGVGPCGGIKIRAVSAIEVYCLPRANDYKMCKSLHIRLSPCRKRLFSATNIPPCTLCHLYHCAIWTLAASSQAAIIKRAGRATDVAVVVASATTITVIMGWGDAVVNQAAGAECFWKSHKVSQGVLHR